MQRDTGGRELLLLRLPIIQRSFMASLSRDGGDAEAGIGRHCSMSRKAII